MFRLCNIIDPTIKHEADQLSDLFDVRNPSIGSLIYSSTFSPRQFIKWIKATITDDNWEHYLTQKIGGQFGVTSELATRYHHYQLLHQLLKNKPKWLMEFIGLGAGDRFTLQSSLFTVTGDAGSYLRHTIDAIHISYTGMPRDLWNNDQYEQGTASFDVEQLTVANQYLEKVLANVNEYLDVSANADSDMDIEYLIRLPFLSRLTHLSVKFLNNRGIIFYNRSGREPENIRPVNAAIRCLELDETLRPRIKFEVRGDHNGLRLWLTMPRSPATREQLGTVLNYTSNVLDYLPFHMRGDREQLSPLYGIELEACSNYTPQQIIAAQDELFFIMKQDGSISGEGRYKYEMVTVPATYKVHKRLWAEFFNKIDYTKFDTSKNTGNGMHVHIDRKAFVAKGHLNKFTWFFINPANFDFLFDISERPSKTDYQRWAPTPELAHIRESKVACMRNAVQQNRNMRGTVHFKGNSTVEIRMFKGVVSYATIIKNLEFVDSIFHFSAETALININLKSYLSWLQSQPVNRYQVIKEFLAQSKNMEQTLLANELKEYLFTENKPEAVIAKLKTAKFTVTNKHLTVLNREKRKRTYILDKEGRLQLAYATGGKLAALDKTLQAKMTRGASKISIALV